ncbi:hypothetical protein ACFFQW_41870 [Umezawaea endophytica]|uniref:Uncharacterized protein n=1 Tax=Umezawaea endophytica TaxID=1654476 RepID=A0A9X2VET5_9PSEU|nr:hypothetical protein [Umezawaea endophytica]MCS7475326.1 hypothetical protein [Umezawaea endophytica]
MTLIRSHLAWWLPAMLVGVIIAAVVLAFGLTARSRLIAIVVAPLWAIGGVSASLSVASNSPRSLQVVLVWGLACGLTVVIVPQTWKTQFNAALYAFGVVAVIALATRAYQATWSAASAAVAMVGLAGLALVAAHLVGPSFYSLMVAAERDETNDTPQVPVLIATLLTGFGVLAAAVPVFVLLGRPLGLDIPTDAKPPSSEWATGYAIGAAAVVALAGVLVASWTRRRSPAEKERPQVNPVAACLVVAASGGLSTVVLHDVLASAAPWPPYVVAYILVLAVAVGVFYGEDLIVTTIRLHLVLENGATRLLAVVGAFTVSALVVWMVERQLWVGPWRGVAFPSALLTLGQFSLGMVCVAAIYFVLAFSTSTEHQQLTVRSTGSNGIQGQALYLFLAAATCWLPSILVARLNPDIPQNVKPLLAFGAVTWLLYRIYAYTTQMNAEHLMHEFGREIKLLAGNPAGIREFRSRLRSHLWWQNKATLGLFAISVVWVMVIPLAVKSRVENNLPSETTPLPKNPEDDESGA